MKNDNDNKKKKPSLLFRSVILLLLLMCIAVIMLPFFTQKQERILAIESQSGQYHTFYALVAKNTLQRMQGLQDVKVMPDDKAMLFVFDEPGHHQMWMHKTHIPLDLIFIKDNVVVYVAPDNQPLSDTVISAPVQSDSILEINAGLAEEKGIKIGDKII